MAESRSHLILQEYRLLEIEGLCDKRRLSEYDGVHHARLMQYSGRRIALYPDNLPSVASIGPFITGIH